MKRKNKLHIGIAMMITTLLVIGSLFPAMWQGEAAYAQNDYSISVDTVKDGSKVTVTVSLANNEPQLDALQFNLAYDENAFALETVDDKKIANEEGNYVNLIGENSQFSATKEYNPYFCSWYVGSGDKPSTTNGVLASFVFEVKETAEAGTYSFSVKDIRGFYNTKETVDGKTKIVENAVNLSTVYREITVDAQSTQRLHTYDEAKLLLEQEAEKVTKATADAKSDALSKYDAEKTGYSIDVAEIVYQELYEDAVSEINKCLNEQLDELASAEAKNQSNGKGGMQTHNISASLKAIQAMSKDSSYFSDGATEEALKAAESSLTVTLDGKRIVNAAIGEDLTSYYSHILKDETIYFCLTVPADGVYGLDAVYKSKDEYSSNSDAVELAAIYKKSDAGYRKLKYEVADEEATCTAGYIDGKYTQRIWACPFENNVKQEILSEGETYVFEVTLKNGFVPQGLKLMSYEYTNLNFVSEDEGTVVSADFYEYKTTWSDEIVINHVKTSGAIAIPKDGYVFDGFYIGETKLTPQYYGDMYYCYSFRNANDEVVAPDDFWSKGGDIYFKSVNCEMVAELTTDQLKVAGLDGIDGEYSSDKVHCQFTLEALMQKIGAKKSIVKNFVRAEYFDTNIDGIKLDEVNTITAKFRPMVYGDADNSKNVDFVDALYLRRSLAGWNGYENGANVCVDLNGDYECTVADVMILEQYIAGWSGVKDKYKIGQDM